MAPRQGVGCAPPRSGSPVTGQDDAGARVEAEARQWLIRLRRDGPAHRDAFEQWYVASPVHADTYDRLLETWEMAGQVQRGQPVVGAPPARFGWRSSIAAVAAILLVMIGVGVASLAGIGRSPANAFSLSTKIGEIRTDRLPDGSHVTLDTDSRVDAVFTASRRQLRLVRGRARIAAARDVTRPMELGTGSVTIGDGEIVDLARSDGRTTVTMLRGNGVVHVGGKVVALAAGQQLAMADAGASTAPRRLDASETRWPSGMLSFDNARLAEVVAEANRYSRVRVVLDGDRVGQIRFTGTFRAGDNAGLARMLAAAFHLKLSRRADGSFQLSAPPDK